MNNPPVYTDTVMKTFFLLNQQIYQLANLQHTARAARKYVVDW